MTVSSLPAQGFRNVFSEGLERGGLQFPSLALADFNGDGRVDVAATGANPGATSIAIFLGKGDGTFTLGRVDCGPTRRCECC
jgi:hypothetical protein